ncbi:F510_1955 family glycosylhydrolase [Chengkuizengella sediminis]|uniref:F510_1955 family glycosylhydrolase n=1 Tax=Chengkuizengella sediminis TaxID=1885917 RepID=UPI00138A5302|nr:YCF48-related protein [Chengkuizengella sediminis]NDI35239.1 glycosyl hydrolase [Chengkuizengella sediminis]
MKRNKIFTLFLLGMTILPTLAAAHGTEDESLTNSMVPLYLFFGFGILFLLFFILFYILKYKINTMENSKNSQERKHRRAYKNKVQWIRIGWIVSLVGVVISGFVYYNPSGSSDDIVEFGHVHGMGYNSGGNHLLLASHTGLKVYEEGNWREGDGANHDYMGFAMTNDGFYASGHPALGSALKNPLGIVKSRDEGESVDQLTLYGKVDFHLTGVSYNTNTFYVMNPEPNEMMADPGLYFTQDETNTWKKSRLEGYPAQLEANGLAVHPDDDSIVVVTSGDGLYLSKNYGDSFEKLFDGDQTTSAYFDFDGKLWVGTYDDQAKIQQMDINSGEIIEVDIPEMPEDAIQYMTQNPKNNQEITIATFNVDVYKSEDGGQNWSIIAEKGKPELNID